MNTIKNMKKQLAGSVIFLLVGFCLVAFSFLKPGVNSNEMDAFRADILTYLRSISVGPRTKARISCPQTLHRAGGWTVFLALYDNGRECAQGFGENDRLGNALLAGVKQMLYADNGTERFSKDELDRMRFFVSLTPSQGMPISFIEYRGKALELVDDVVAVRQLTKEKIAAQITAGKEYLLRMMDPEKHAFFKRFDAKTGKGEDQLRTIYTASSLYTFLKMDKIDEDNRIRDAISPIASFLLSMQVADGEQKGAFHYSFFLDTKEKENMFVVGTASKTIFTLLALYDTRKDNRYLNAARAAGDWLLSMQREDGTIRTYATFRNGTWHYGKKFSCLYTGQVLSALSRLYGATKDVTYLEGAKKIARILSEKARRDGYFLKDEYRLSNDPIPTSWVVMSLLDYYKVSHDKKTRNIVRRSAQELLKRQKRDRRDILNYGRFDGTQAGSGNGWINEVLGELYAYGKAQKWRGYERYREAMVLVSRWLIQNTYSPENTYFLEHPEKVYGGIIRNQQEESVRTDAVCHGVNGYIMLLNMVSDDFSLCVREEPLD